MRCKHCRGYKVAVVGATGAVGTEMIRVLEERNFPVSELKLFASSRSAGKKLGFKGEQITVCELTQNSFEGIEIALFSAGASRSKEFAPYAVSSGTVVIDNSSAFRMEKDVPLVVPEVNPQDIKWHKGIIANPNCSTIQMVVALKPLHDLAEIKRIVVITYQSVSGTGSKAMRELESQAKAYINGDKIPIEVYPHQILFNVIPEIGKFLDTGYSEEEMKMVNETKKIMGDDSIRVAATTARVPVLRAHSEAVNVEFEREITPQQAREILQKTPGVVVIDNPANHEYPLAINASRTDPVYVGRIRKDTSVEHGLDLWIVSDNLLKGAALNAVQIAEELIKEF
ncbi:MAG: aspartate-semialdehyde dehydrogenase [bacterium]|nr:aspartate-semialdehyde dehydrogenase [bacterium]